MKPHPFVVLIIATAAAAAHPQVRTLEELVVSGKAENLLGSAESASQGQSSREELLERPFLRRGELLEVVPGMVVTQHSGDGKANQYFVRGYNLDHGTDFGIFVDGMPANYRSHAHGQGYADMNFLIPEFIERLDYTKSPSSARFGDLTTAGAAEFSLVDELRHGFAGVTFGEDDYYRFVSGDSFQAGPGVLTVGGEATYYDGPWKLPMHSERYNGLLRWHTGSGEDFFNVTFMGSQGDWRATDQIPRRAARAGLIDRYGFVDPTDGGESQRYSLSANFSRRTESVLWRANAYAGYYDLDLFSNFTYVLNDPIDGDQFRQSENRFFAGGDISVTFDERQLFGKDAAWTIGFQTRNDWIGDLALANTAARRDVSLVREDDVYTGSFSLYGEVENRWTPWFRTVTGLRGDLFAFDVDSDNDVNSGDEIDTTLVPKLSLIFGPWSDTEIYMNLGGGFHSNDARGVTLGADPADPLVRTWGAEIGTRSQWTETFTTTLAFWALKSESELLYVGDAGEVEAGPSTTRIGVETAAYWRPYSWLLADAELSWSEGRYDDADEAGGPYIENQVPLVFAAGLRLGAEEGFYGSLRSRVFSRRPLTADRSVESRASFQLNGRLAYRKPHWELALDVLNLLDRKDNDIEYYYESQLPGEADPVEDVHFHPNEPRTFRVSFTYFW